MKLPYLVSISTVGLLAAATVLARNLGPHPTPSATTPTRLVSVQVLTDRLDPVDGAILRVGDGTTERVVVTDSFGQSPWIAEDPTNGLDLVMADKVITGGTLLGLIEHLPPFPLDSTIPFNFWDESRTQPLAAPILVEGKRLVVNNIMPPAGDYPHWRVAVPMASSLRFSMGVAPLLDHEIIGQYLAYRGITPNPSLNYVRGVAMVVPSVQLGNDGIIVAIDLLGDLPNGVVADLYNFAPAASSPPSGPALGIRVIQVAAGTAYMHVHGAVRSGHLALLLRDSSGPAASVTVVTDSPPIINVPSDAGQGIDTVFRTGRGAAADANPVAAATVLDPTSVSTSSTSPFVTDCDPPTPSQDGWTCDIANIPSTSCGAGTTTGQKECKTARQRSPTVCRSAGSTFSRQVGRTVKWKVTIALTGGQAPLTSTGGFEYGEDSTEVTNDGWTAQPGAFGLGQCMRYFIFNLVCAQSYIVKVDGVMTATWVDGVLTISLNNCTQSQTVNAGCHDTRNSQSTCDRSP